MQFGKVPFRNLKVAERRRGGVPLLAVLVGLFASHLAVTDWTANASNSEHISIPGVHVPLGQVSLAISNDTLQSGLNCSSAYSTEKPFVELFKTSMPWQNFARLAQADVVAKNGWINRILDGDEISRTGTNADYFRNISVARAISLASPEFTRELAQYTLAKETTHTGYDLDVRQVHSGHSLTDSHTNSWWELGNMINSFGRKKDRVARSTIPGSEMRWRRESVDSAFYGNPNAWKDIADFELLVITERNDIYPEALYPTGRKAEYRLERREEFSRWVNHAWRNGNDGNGAATMLFSVWTDLEVSDPGFRERLDIDGVEWEAMADYANEKRPSEAPPVVIIPGHRVMARLYDDIEQGLVPGVANIQEFFGDDVHPNHLGGYMISLLHLAAIHQVDLTNVPTRFGGGSDRQPLDLVPSPEIAAYLKLMVQDVVTSYQNSRGSDVYTSDDI